MFPCGHIHYSLLANDDATRDQLVGAVLPDAAATAAFEWTDLHQVENVEQFAASTNGDPITYLIIEGVRHHITVDDRSHLRWHDGGGYAYDNQTEELRNAVALACHVEDDLARTLAHNFIETAVDLHVLSARPNVLDRVHDALIGYDTRHIATHIAHWTGADTEQVATRITKYFDLVCKHNVTTVDGMIYLWSDLLDVLQVTTFNVTDPQPLDRLQARHAIELALVLAEPEALAVVTP